MASADALAGSTMMQESFWTVGLWTNASTAITVSDVLIARMACHLITTALVKLTIPTAPLIAFAPTVTHAAHALLAVITMQVASAIVIFFLIECLNLFTLIACKEGCSECTGYDFCTVWNITDVGILSCSNVNPNCQSCYPDGECQQCNPPYSVSNGECVNMCSRGPAYCQDGCRCDLWQSSCDYCKPSYYSVAGLCLRERFFLLFCHS